MKIPCDAYIEPQGARARQQHFSQLRPVVCKSTSVAVDRDEARDVCLFVGKTPGNRPHLVCKVEDVVDIDARQVNDGCIGLRLSAPPVQVMIYNTRALVLEDFVRLLRKLTERRKIGTSVRFRCSPEQVLESQRIERETVTNGSMNSAVLPANVANVLGGFYMQASASYAGAAIASTRTSPSASAAQHASSAEATPSQPLKAALDGEIEGLRKAMEIESRDRGSLMDRVARLERENSYLNSQLQMEQKKQAEYKETVRDAQRQTEEAEMQLQEKKLELHQRTHELMEARNGHEDVIEEGLRRMHEVEAYTALNVEHVRTLQRRVAGMMAQRLDMRTAIHAVRRWRAQASTVMGRMELLRQVHRRYLNQVLGRPLMCWKERSDFVIFLSRALPRLALGLRRKLLAGVFRRWHTDALRSAREKTATMMEDLKAAAHRENELSAQLREAEEMLAEAYAAQTTVDKAVRDQKARCEREIEEARDLLEASQTEERRVRVQLEEVSKELKATKGAELSTRAALSENLQSHELETQVLRERLRAAEAAFDGLKVKLRESQARQQDLEDMLSKNQGAVGDKAATIGKLQGTVSELEGQSRRLMQQLQQEETSRARAEAARQGMQLKLEELERNGSVMARGREVVESEYEEEMQRRTQLEDALAKLIKAFKEAKQEHRRKLLQAGEYVRMLAAFFEWRRTAAKSAQEDRPAHSNLLSAADEASFNLRMGEMHELREEKTALEEAVERLSADLRVSRAREEQANSQLTSLKETYLKGVKASVQSIRQCRDKYLPTNSAPDED